MIPSPTDDASRSKPTTHTKHPQQQKNCDAGSLLLFLALACAARLALVLPLIALIFWIGVRPISLTQTMERAAQEWTKPYTRQAEAKVAGQGK